MGFGLCCCRATLHLHFTGGFCQGSWAATLQIAPPCVRMAHVQARNVMLKSSGSEGRGVICKVTGGRGSGVIDALIKGRGGICRVGAVP